jgi:probable phosphoglycerate mutase
MTKILLTRHGHVDGIRPKRFRGRAELPLTPEGVVQAAALARRIARMWKPVAIYTSALQRCVSTGARIAEACGASAAALEGLMNIDYGDWQMRPEQEVEVACPALYQRWRTAPHLARFPRGESLQDLVARTADALRLVLERHDGDTVVLVGHDSVNRALLLQVLEQPLSAYWRIAQDPAALNEIDIVGTTATVRRINDTAHLEKDHLDQT